MGPPEPGANLAAILGAWTALLQSGSPDALGALLDEAVVWEGLVPEARCSNRRDVLRLLRVTGRRAPRLTRIEAEEFGDQVVVSVGGPDFQANEWLDAAAPRSLAFTFRAGRVVRMRSFAGRDEAFASAAG